MGNIRTKDIKKATFQLIEAYPDKFNGDFENNKLVLNDIDIANTKLMRNKLAGYITRVKNRD